MRVLTLTAKQLFHFLRFWDIDKKLVEANKTDREATSIFVVIVNKNKRSREDLNLTLSWRKWVLYSTSVDNDIIIDTHVKPYVTIPTRIYKFFT